MRIIASHRLRPRGFTDREAKTDALGRFAIELPAGDWAIKGVRPDGKIFSIRDITVAGGRITPDVTLTLDPAPPGMPTLDLSPTSDTGRLGDHRTSAARVLLIGRADPNVTIILLPSGARTKSDDAGLLRFPGVALGPGENVVTARVQDAAGHAADATLTITRVGEPSAADPVLAWVRMTLEAIRGDAVAPPVATRDLAIVSAAIFDAVAAIQGTPGYHFHEIAPADASAEAATAAAAHRALVHLYPERAATFDAGLADSLAAVPDGPGKDHGVALGRTVADAILALRGRWLGGPCGRLARGRPGDLATHAAAARLAPDAAVGDGPAVPPGLSEAVPAPWAASPGQPRLGRRLQRGQGDRPGRQRKPHRRADPDRPHLGRRRGDVHPARALEPDRRSGGPGRGQQPHRQRPALRRVEPGHGRRRHRLLGRQVRLPLLAPRDRHPRRRHRRQPGHRSRPVVDAPADDAELPRVRLRPQYLQRRAEVAAGSLPSSHQERSVAQPRSWARGKLTPRRRAHATAAGQGARGPAAWRGRCPRIVTGRSRNSSASAWRAGRLRAQ